MSYDFDFEEHRLATLSMFRETKVPGTKLLSIVAEGVQSDVLELV
jgi:hypothetical protein